jgi:hypothetical protein
MVKIQPILSRTLANSGFEVQRQDGDLYFVRNSDREHLFERIELVFTGPKKEAIVLMMGLVAVRDVSVQYRGLLVRGSLHELRTDPENGRIQFASPNEVLPWSERLTEIAPSKLRAFAHQHGDELLLRTAEARHTAERAYRLFAEPVLPDELSTFIGSGTEEQRRVVANLASRPMVIGSEVLRVEFTAAVTALVLAEDPDLLSLGEVSLQPARGLELINQIKMIPDEVIWKIRILTDMILRSRTAMVARARELAKKAKGSSDDAF